MQISTTSISVQLEIENIQQQIKNIGTIEEKQIAKKLPISSSQQKEVEIPKKEMPKKEIEPKKEMPKKEIDFPRKEILPKKIPTCSLEGCDKPCHVEGHRVHGYCGKFHSIQGKALKSKTMKMYTNLTKSNLS